MAPLPNQGPKAYARPHRAGILQCREAITRIPYETAAYGRCATGSERCWAGVEGFRRVEPGGLLLDVAVGAGAASVRAAATAPATSETADPLGSCAWSPSPDSTAQAI